MGFYYLINQTVLTDLLIQACGVVLGVVQQHLQLQMAIENGEYKNGLMLGYQQKNHLIIKKRFLDQ